LQHGKGGETNLQVCFSQWAAAADGTTRAAQGISVSIGRGMKGSICQWIKGALKMFITFNPIDVSLH
jgi:hypothetical protein